TVKDRKSKRPSVSPGRIFLPAFRRLSAPSMRMKKMRRSVYGGFLSFWPFILAALLTTLAQGQAPGSPPERRNTPPGLDEATFLHHENSGQPIHVTLSLDLRDRIGAEALTAAQHDPSSPLYGKWITPKEFQSRFGPLPEDLQAARDYLVSEGFTAVEIPA